MRFALSQLPAQNAHHVFEHICRHLTQQFICSNVLPATGPVSAGGDQGRDIETFRTYLREELGPHGGFLGLVSEGTIAFICTTQTNGLRAKLRDDIAKVCTSGHRVHEIRAFTLEPIPVGIRHQLEHETHETYGVRLEFHDAESVANLIARPEGFWVAEHFLSIPAEIRPEPATTDVYLSAEYVERRRRWREQDHPIPTLGAFIDLKAGLREATFQQQARSDLPFWLGLVRQVLANPECPAHIQQRARYELVVATFRGTHEFRSVDDVARAYLEEALNETEPARLLDASTLLTYANTAAQWGSTSLTPTELGDWNASLTTRAQYLVAEETSEASHRRANLLFTIGHLGLHPAMWEPDVQNFIKEVYAEGQQNPGDELPDPANISLPGGSFFADASLAFSTWSEIMDDLEKTPLFPIETLADILQLLVPLWSQHAEWRELLDAVDAALGERSGRHTIGARARDRAMTLLKSGRCLDALEEFHQAKVEWWSWGNVAWIAPRNDDHCRAVFGAKAPAGIKVLRSGCIPTSLHQEEMRSSRIWFPLDCSKRLVQTSLREPGAAQWNCMNSAWRVQYEFIEDGADFEKHPRIQNALLHLGYASACSKIVNPGLAALIGGVTVRIDADDIIENAIDVLNSEGKDFWESFGATGLVARPFSDMGDVRYIHFSALGTDWTVVMSNDLETVRLGERFAGAAQAMLAALAREDLCFVQSQINVRVENRQRIQTESADRIESLPSNDGRRWVVRLVAYHHCNDGW